jgi:hypothetical protein
MLLSQLLQSSLHVDVLGLADFAHILLSDAVCVLLLPFWYAFRINEKRRKQEKTGD